MSLIEAGYVEGDVMITLLCPFEVFRRFMWNFFRLENEHLNNCGKFRAIRDISVAPMDCSDQVGFLYYLWRNLYLYLTFCVTLFQTFILRMMDEEDGVINRRTKTKMNKLKKQDSSKTNYEDLIS